MNFLRNKMKFFLLILSTIVISLSANDNMKKVDCIILNDENSIICKYNNTRFETESTVIFNWIEPSGEITRSRKMFIPVGHVSVYDFRFLFGRKKGEWTLQVEDLNNTFETKFIIE